ncbi:alpha/beta-hydrolase [Hypoxylon sp. FL1284]|nr:alpha/beta-hydrolase [Hypoxylon sp. FL1284]
MTDDFRQDRRQPLPILSRLSNAVAIFGLQYLTLPALWYRDWFHPPEIPPNIVRSYPCRPSLSIRVFQPKSYDATTSSAPLPTLFSIHGGGFCLGRPNDDDAWNARFASMHGVQVIALDYRKAPAHAFPTAVYDCEALLLAACDDAALPVDRARVAVCGFSAGGCLALTVSQLPAVRDKVKPAAALPVYPVVDQSIPAALKGTTRHYKPALGGGVRAELYDYLATFSPILLWGYLSPGLDLRDPRISPYFTPRDNLPPHLFFIATELDQLAHETWCMASKLAGRPEPALADRVGREQPAENKGQLILDDDRFAFEHVDPAAGRSVRWLLVPDQLHGFDRLPENWHDKEGLEDARLKEVACQKLMGEWLRDVVWR